MNAFPANLTPAERMAIEAMMAHGDHKRAGRALGISHHTVASHLQTARSKAAVTSTLVMAVMYLKATMGAAK